MHVPPNRFRLALWRVSTLYISTTRQLICSKCPQSVFAASIDLCVGGEHALEWGCTDCVGMRWPCKGVKSVVLRITMWFHSTMDMHRSVSCSCSLSIFLSALLRSLSSFNSPFSPLSLFLIVFTQAPFSLVCLLCYCIMIYLIAHAHDAPSGHLQSRP